MAVRPAHIIPALFTALIIAMGSTAAVADEARSDDYLAGYASSVLERELGWEAGSYCIDVLGGNATITLFNDDKDRERAAMEKLSGIYGLGKVDFAYRAADAAGEGKTVCVASVRETNSAGISTTGEWLPDGDVFRPLIADPKQPRFFVSLYNYNSSVDHYNVASVGYGETFGFYRWMGATDEEGLQVSLAGALFAQFDLDAASFDLVNADYTLGIPITYRSGGNAYRLRLYHQSSHLGDEYLLRVHPQRINLSFESVEMIYSRDIGPVRLYGGGEFLIHHEPAELDPWIIHGGIEYMGPDISGGHNVIPVAGVDIKSFEEHDWSVDACVKAGIQLGDSKPDKRRVRIMAEWFKGYDPNGQFYPNKIDFYGAEVSFGF